MIPRKRWRLAADRTASAFQLFVLMSSSIWRFPKFNISCSRWFKLMSDISPNIVEWIFIICCSLSYSWLLLLFSLSLLTVDCRHFYFCWYVRWHWCFSFRCLRCLCLIWLLLLSFVVDVIELVFVCGFVVVCCRFLVLSATSVVIVFFEFSWRVNGTSWTAVVLVSSVNLICF